MSESAPRVFDLSDMRPDGWLDQVLAQSSDFEKACDIIGRSTLGLALVAGAQIQSLSIDNHMPDLTSIEFKLGEETLVRRALLSEFRKQIATLLLRPLPVRLLEDDPTPEALQAYVGGRYMLAAALFGVQPQELRVHAEHAEVAVVYNEVEHLLSLQDFRSIIDERVRSELRLNDDGDEMAIDLSALEAARAASDTKDWQTTITILTPWLTPISMLLRTGEADDLSEEVHHQLASGLELLGVAYSESGEFQAANEVLRLGVQWAGDGTGASHLFLRLGQACVSAGKHGEAIGLLRRAIGLGGDGSAAFPLLAECLLAREQHLAAMVCLQRASDAGADESATDEARSAAHSHLGEAWDNYMHFVDAASD